MIKVTRLGGKTLVLNAELIQFVEATPDTVITLVNHEKLLVEESTEEVRRLVLEYRRSVRAFAGVAEPGDGEAVAPKGGRPARR